MLKVRIDPENGKRVSDPKTLISNLEIYDSDLDLDFSVSREANRLSFNKYTWNSNLSLITRGEDKKFTMKASTTGTRKILFPKFAPDGKQIAFIIQESERSNIYSIPVVNGTMTQLTFMNAYARYLAWSPDGTEIVFTAIKEDKNILCKTKLDGRDLYQFKRARPAAGQVTWNPGANILYQLPGNKTFHFLDPKTEAERPLFKEQPLQWVFSPVFSPNGKKLALYMNRLPMPHQTGWIISLTDFSEKILNEKFFPKVWSGDGQWIYGVEYTDDWGQGSIVKVSATTGDTIRMEDFPIEGEKLLREQQIDIASDGKQIVVAVEDEKSDVWVIDNFDPEFQRSLPPD